MMMTGSLHTTPEDAAVDETKKRKREKKEAKRLKKEKKAKKRKRERQEKIPSPAGDESFSSNSSAQKQRSNKKSTTKRSKRRREEEEPATTTASRPEERKRSGTSLADLSVVPAAPPRSTRLGMVGHPFPYRHVLAPMVGASELAFRLLCRAYGADLCYTPMMSARAFATDESYRRSEFQTCRNDRPLVCHFWANCPEDLAAAAKVAAPHCDAIDLNLGCPQRTAYLGHFGSYLLDPCDRDLLLRIVRAGADAAHPTPLCCKIRLLDTFEQTLELCQQLQDAGAAWIAVHARHRASWERTGPGARDGPAKLEQVRLLKERLRIPVISNGNVKSFQDVLDNLQLTQADAIMSAEGLLDDPALFFPVLESDPKNQSSSSTAPPASTGSTRDDNGDNADVAKMRRKLRKRLREIQRLEAKSSSPSAWTPEECDKVARKAEWTERLHELEGHSGGRGGDGSAGAASLDSKPPPTSAGGGSSPPDPLALALEYLDLVRLYPAAMRTVVFHVRRMLKDDLMKYQVLDDLLASESLDRVRELLDKIEHYRLHPETFVHDRRKAQEQKEALERRRREEGKRRAFEERMIRKARREKLADPHHYLNVGAAVPTTEEIGRFRSMERGSEELLRAWKAGHSQHCLSFHLDPGGCPRGRACAFLHVDANHFAVGDEVAG